MDEHTFFGDEICVEEMPQGCIITKKNSLEEIQISSIKDAKLLIESLLRMIYALCSRRSE